jgi:hypothetical protein
MRFDLLVPARRRRRGLRSRGMAQAVASGCECRVYDRCGLSRHHCRATSAWKEESVVRVAMNLDRFFTYDSSHNFIAS